MPWEKGNSYWRKAVDAKKENKERMAEFLEQIAGGAIPKYIAKLEDLSEGEELSKPEVDFMDRTERWAEFIQPKLARNEGSQKIDQTVTFKWDDGNNDTLQAKSVPEATE